MALSRSRCQFHLRILAGKGSQFAVDFHLAGNFSRGAYIRRIDFFELISNFVQNSNYFAGAGLARTQETPQFPIPVFPYPIRRGHKSASFSRHVSGRMCSCEKLEQPTFPRPTDNLISFKNSIQNGVKFVSTSSF